MSTHIVVTTHLEEPKVYLAQIDYKDLIQSLRNDPYLAHQRNNVYALQPDPNPDHQPRTLNAIRLMKVGSTDDRSPATAHFQEALYFASQSGEVGEQMILQEFKAIIDKLLVTNSVPSGS